MAGRILIRLRPTFKASWIAGLCLSACASWPGADQVPALKGFPVAAAQGGEGPWHLQRVEEMEADRVVIAERVESDGRRPQLYRLALDENPEDASAAYNLACALARLGQTERALTYLGLAVDLDRRRLSVIAATDPDLDPLRELSAFRRLFDP